MAPQVQYAKCQGASIAYQVFGDGSIPLVGVPPLAQNIDLAWEWPAIRHLLERLGAFSRYLHFDKRGTGMSDPSFDAPGLDQRVDDLRAVMDDAGIGRAFLLGVSDGGPMALLFAASYPERVAGIVLDGSAARLVPDEPDASAQEQLIAAFAERWGTPESITADVFAPSLAGDAAFRRWHQRYERQAASPSMLRQLLAMKAEMDVRGILGEVRCPVVAVHRTGDRIVPVALARETVDALPDARLVELPGDDHFDYAGDADALIDEIERFVTGTVIQPSTSVRRLPITVTTLGRFAVSVDGSEAPSSAWGSRRARTLCQRLVAARGQPVTRDALVELLWPDDGGGDQPGARLSVALSTVRRMLRGGIVADRSTVRLDTDAVDCDLVRLHAADDDAAVLSIYGGTFLPGELYDDWTLRPREEARAVFLSAAHRRLADLLAEGDSDAVMALVARILDEDPYDEPAHRGRILALHGAGAHGAARDAHLRYAEAMADLGVAADCFTDIVAAPEGF